MAGPWTSPEAKVVRMDAELFLREEQFRNLPIARAFHELLDEIPKVVGVPSLEDECQFSLVGLEGKFTVRPLVTKSGQRYLQIEREKTNPAARVFDTFVFFANGSSQIGFTSDNATQSFDMDGPDAESECLRVAGRMLASIRENTPEMLSERAALELYPKLDALVKGTSVEIRLPGKGLVLKLIQGQYGIRVEPSDKNAMTPFFFGKRGELFTQNGQLFPDMIEDFHTAFIEAEAFVNLVAPPPNL